MKKLHVTTKSPGEIAAEFAAVFKAIKPMPSVAVTQADRLAPYRRNILKQRRRGLTWRQIADGMADPRINEKVTEKVLRQLFGAKEKPANVSPKPPVEHLILDPLTGLRITPPPA